MEYRKTQTRKGINYYRIDLDGGDYDPDFNSLPEHWQRACWDLQGEDKKSNRDWPEALVKGTRPEFNGDNCLWIYWNDDDGEYYLNWRGPSFEEIKT